jgi:hypothetical protein
VAWSDSFKAAGIIILYFVGWGIIGGFFVGLGIVGMGDPTSSLYKGTNTLQFLISGLIALVGIIIVALGSLASLIKVFAELLKEEIS